MPVKLFAAIPPKILTEEKNIQLIRINPDMNGAYFVQESDQTRNKREVAESKGMSIPNWNGAGIFAPKGNFLSDKIRCDFLDSQESIWFKNATVHLKNQMLNAVEMGLRELYGKKDYFSADLTPKEIKSNLIDKAKAINNAKKALSSLGNMPLVIAKEVYSRSSISHSFRFENAASSLSHIDNYPQLNDLLFSCWLNLDEVEKTLKEAAKTIEISKAHKPSTLEMHSFTLRLAEAWKYLTDEYPPHSKDGVFYAFLEKIGRECQLKITANSVSKIVKSMVKKDKNSS